MTAAAMAPRSVSWLLVVFSFATISDALSPIVLQREARSRSALRSHSAPPLADAISLAPAMQISSEQRIPRHRPVCMAHWMDVLKHGGAKPDFDVLEKTRLFVSKTTHEEVAPFYTDDYVFRGPIIGPITAADVADAQKRFNVMDAYPDIDRGIFGMTVDPNNPWRVLLFERWTGTHTGDINTGFSTLPPTGNKVELPVHVTSIVWTPEGKIKYQSISQPIDRFEGDTKGVGAIFGLLVGAGLPVSSASVGDFSLRMQQRLFQWAAKRGLVGKQWSDDEEIPAWWKSKAVGADPNDL